MIFTFLESVKNNTSFSIMFKSPIYSTKGNILKNSELQSNFFEFVFIPKILRNIIEKTKKSSKISASISIMISIITNPSSAWLLINTLQLIYFMPLSKKSLSPAVDKFCEAVSQYNIIPNAVELLFSKPSQYPAIDQAAKIGIDTSLIWINIGSEITLMCALLVAYPFIWVLLKLKLKFITQKLNSLLQLYKFSIFLRFWLQNHLIIGLYSIINIESVNLIRLQVFQVQHRYSP